MNIEEEHETEYKEEIKALEKQLKTIDDSTGGRKETEFNSEKTRSEIYNSKKKFESFLIVSWPWVRWRIGV